MSVCGRDRLIVLVELEGNDFRVLVNLGSKRGSVFEDEMVEFGPDDVPYCVIVPQGDEVRV